MVPERADRSHFLPPPYSFEKGIVSRRIISLIVVVDAVPVSFWVKVHGRHPQVVRVVMASQVDGVYVDPNVLLGFALEEGGRWWTM
jgi:hypothetical protein